MRRIFIGLVAVALGVVAAPQARAAEPEAPDAGRDLRQGAEKDLDARVSRLLAEARKAFEARDYDASRRLAYAACELRPSNAEAQEMHRLSIYFGRRLRAASRPARSGESADQAIERLSGDKTLPWIQAPAGSEAKGAASREEAPVPEWQARLEKRLADKATVAFQGDKFSVVKEYFEGLLGCPIVVDRRFKDKVMDLPVRFQAKDMPVGQILGWIVGNELGLQFAPVEGALYLSDADGVADKAGVLAVYDVGDLVYESQMPDFVAPRLGLPEVPGRVMGLQAEPDLDEPASRPRGLTPEQLVRILERATGLKSEDKDK